MPFRVIVDSNFLMIPSQFGLDIFRELVRVLNRAVQIVVLSPVYDELHRISLEGHPKICRQATMALAIIEGIEVVSVPLHPKETVDDLVIRIADQWNCPVATNDSKLRRKLRSIGVPVIYLRQGARLEIEGLGTAC